MTTVGDVSGSINTGLSNALTRAKAVADAGTATGDVTLTAGQIIDAEDAINKVNAAETEATKAVKETSQQVAGAAR